jgi:RHS repeat-associated protein
MAKIQGGNSYSIITDHLGTPTEAYNDQGRKGWSRGLNIYGETRKETGLKNFIPYLYQGQYLDVETELAYNRFRYYSPESGMYVSQDPIGLIGGMPNMYSYVRNSNILLDPFGLDEVFNGTVYRGMLTDANGSATVYSGATVPDKGLNAAKSLGIRPGEAGMSTGIDPHGLQPHRKPPEFGGSFKKGTMFGIDTSALDKYGLEAIKDGDNHVSIKTKKGVDPSELGDRLSQTKDDWVKKACG